MNNVDDGIEIWGGAVNLKFFSIWNIGDDSLDIDQGWRGKAQFGLICQGWSLINASQGSGVGDNAIEMDGAEDSDWQPVTTATLYNMTVIGNPANGDGLTAWRDNANVQIRNSIFMFGAEQVVRADNDDGDGANGYGHNGTLSFAQRWNTPYSVTSPVNAAANPAAIYQSQVDGNLIEITNSFFFGNVAANAYTEANAQGVFATGNGNTLDMRFAVADAPVMEIGFTLTNLPVEGPTARVASLDPRPVGISAGPIGSSAPADGFFTPADYQGAFNPDSTGNWLQGWSASEEFGLVPSGTVGVNACEGGVSTFDGVSAEIRAFGSDVVADNNLTLEATGVTPLQFGIFLVSRALNSNPTTLPGSFGLLCLDPGSLARFTNPNQIVQASLTGVLSLPVDLTVIPQGAVVVPAVAGETFVFQAWFRSFLTPTGGISSGTSDAVSITFQ